MGQSIREEDLVDEVRTTIRRVDRLERSQAIPPRYTTTERPAAVDEPGMVIYNITTNKHQGSNGSSWSDFY